MARTIPTYQRQVIESGVQSAPTASGNISANDPIANGMANLGQSGGNLAGVLQQEQEQKAKDRAAIDVANVLSQGEVYWQEDFNKRAQAWTPGAADMRDGIGQDFDKWVSDSAAKLPTEQARNYFQQHAVSMKTRMQTGAYTFQEKTTTAKLNVDTDIGVEDDKKVMFADPSRFDELLRRRGETILARSDLSPAEKTKQVNDLKGKYSLATETGKMMRDPGEWLRQNYGADPSVKGAAPVAAASATAAGPVADALWKAQVNQESGGKQFGKDGKPLTSSAGAIGVAQVMPGTAPEAAKLAGLPWDERRYQQDAGYNEALGKAYMAKQLQTFGGDVSKALAAYNMGPGSIKNQNGVAWLVKKHGENWLQHAPAETRDYVAKITRRAGVAGMAAAPAAGAPMAAASTGTVSDAGNGMGAAVIPATRSATLTNLDLEQQLQLKSMAESRAGQMLAKARSDLDQTLRDATAMHVDGKADPFNLGLEGFQKAYGAEGAQKFADYQKSQAMGADIGKFAAMPAGQIAASLNAGQDEVDGLADSGGAGYAVADARQKVRQQAAQRVIEQRDKDPVGYAVKNSDFLRAQQQALDNPKLTPAERPAMVQRFVRENLAEQQRLGVATPRVLTPGQADAIAARAMNAQKPEDSANLIAGLEAEYGGYFPRVFNELVKGKKIAGELQIIPNLPSPAAREMVSRLARIKESDLVQGIDAPDQKAIKDAVTETLSGFAKAVPMMTEQAAGVVNSYETSMRKMAYQLVQGGMKPADAAQRANEVLLGHYKFEDTMRIPKSVDAGVVTSGTRQALKTGLDNIDVPADVAGGRDATANAKEWANTVRARPQWFTSDDDSGVDLWANGANGVRYRVTRGGQPVRFTWGELKGTVETERAKLESVGQNGRGRMREYNQQLRQQAQEFNRANGVN